MPASVPLPGPRSWCCGTGPSRGSLDETPLGFEESSDLKCT